MTPGPGCAAPTAALALFVLLACVTLVINAVSTTYALARARAASTESRSTRADALLLLVRCFTLLALAVAAAVLWKHPYWLVGVASATAIVQSLDLAVGISLRARTQIRAALLGVGTEATALALFLLVDGTCLG